MANLVQIKLANGKKVLTEIASSPEEQRVGMLKHDSIIGKPAMLFPYADPTDVTFHTIGMKFPIDIVMLERIESKKAQRQSLSELPLQQLQEALAAMEELGEQHGDGPTYQEMLDEIHRRVETGIQTA